jgi:hypothetical protein
MLIESPVWKLQRALSLMPAVDLPTEHFFADGMYCRSVFRAAGVVIVGKVHRKEHLYIVARGLVRVTTDDGVRDVPAGSVIVSRPGTKRAVLAIQDSVCMTVHRTDKTDLSEIERELLEEDDSAVMDSENRVKFDVPAFRELTARVIKAEKPGFWSDWTEAERALYTSGDWRAFSTSRGYTSAEIDDYGRWLDSIAEAKNKGVNPYLFIGDLALPAAAKNMALDTKGEIMKSSHLPHESRQS